MAQQRRIVDLRNIRGSIRGESASPRDSLLGKKVAVPREKPKSEPSPLPSSVPQYTEWSVFEYEPKELEPYWYVVPVGVMIVFVGFALFIKNYFFAVFMAIACSGLLLYRIRPPKKISFAITEEGISVGKTLYEFRRITSFYIFAKAGVKELSLETTHTLSPYVRVPLGNTNEEEVRQALLVVLPEKQHQEFMMDEFIRAIGF